MIKKIKIYNDIFFYTTYVYLCTTSKDFDKVVGDLKINSVSLDTYSGLHTEIGGDSYIVLNKYDIPVLVHEINHLVVALCKTTGVEYVKENEEVISYLLGYYTEKIIKGLK